MHRGLIKTSFGNVHFTCNMDPASASGLPVVCFHMSPRSADEFREVQQVLGEQGRLVVAVDELGYGQSDAPTRSITLEEIALCNLEVIDHLQLREFVASGQRCPLKRTPQHKDHHKITRRRFSC